MGMLHIPKFDSVCEKGTCNKCLRKNNSRKYDTSAAVTTEPRLLRTQRKCRGLGCSEAQPSPPCPHTSASTTSLCAHLGVCILSARTPVSTWAMSSTQVTARQVGQLMRRCAGSTCGGMRPTSMEQQSQHTCRALQRVQVQMRQESGSSSSSSSFQDMARL